MRHTQAFVHLDGPRPVPPDPVAPPRLPAHPRSAADPALAPAGGTCGSARSRYQNAARGSAEPPRAGTGIRSSPLPAHLRSCSARARARRSLRPLVPEWLCYDARRSPCRTCAQVAEDGSFADRGKKEPLVVCWLAELLPVGASACPVLCAIVRPPAARLRSPSVTSRFRAECYAIAAAGRRFYASELR